MKHLTVRGLLFAGSLIAGVSYVPAAVMPMEITSETPDITWMTINLETPGTLGVEILYKVDRLSDVQHIRVTGTINAKDWVTISNLISAEAIDLSGASSAGAGIPDAAFKGNTALRSIILPADLPSIGAQAFQESVIESITIPASVTSLGSELFRDATSIVSANFLCKAAIPVGCFIDCNALEEVTLTEGCPSIGRYAFTRCTALSKINFPEGLTTIGDQAFGNTTKLEEVIFPESLSVMDQNCFTGSGIKRVVFGINPVTFAWNPFGYNQNLEEITLPGGNVSYNYFGNICPSVKKIICPAATPPVINNSFDKVDMSQVDLVVPEFALVAYKLDSFWGKAATITTGVESDRWVIGSELQLLSGHRMPGTPSVTIVPGGQLHVAGAEAMPMNTFALRNDLTTAQFGQLINAGTPMTATAGEYAFTVIAGRWYFISFPSDVKVSDLRHSKDADFVVRSYDGEYRAEFGAGSSWKDVPADGVLKAGQGYILQAQQNGDISVALSAEATTAMIDSKDRTVEVKSWKAESAEDDGWNFIGNPFPCYYDMYSSSLTSPITLWDGEKYVAFSMTDDDVVLAPMQGFFMQQAETDGEISFGAAGRQFSTELTRPASAMGTESRTVINLLLSNPATEATDRTRIVANPSASVSYEPSCDAAKFFGESASALIYSLGEGNVAMAINERPMDDAAVGLGYRVASEGTYAIVNSSPKAAVILTDRAKATTVTLASGEAYSFDTNAGINDSRFSVKLAAINPTSVEETLATAASVAAVAGALEIQAPVGAEVAVFGIDGTTAAAFRMTSGSARVPAAPGMYVVRINEQSFKCIVSE